jgi:hypothetical protein
VLSSGGSASGRIKEVSEVELHNLEGLQVTVLATQQDAWLEEELRPLIESGKINYINTDTQPDALAQAGLTRAELDVPVAIISRPGDDQGSCCVLSQVGESIIAHCEDKVVPLKERS